MENETDKTVTEKARTVFDNIGFVVVPLIAIILLGLLVAFWKFDRSANYCPARIMRTAISLDGLKAAVVGSVNCGSFIDDFRVAIADPNDLKNVEKYTTVFKTRGRYSITIVWVDAHTLKITLPKNAQLAAPILRTEAEGIKIIYD